MDCITLPKGERIKLNNMPDTLDISAQVKLGMNHLLRFNDPDMGHLPYTGVSFTKYPQCLEHALEGFDWLEANSYGILGLIGSRQVTGSSEGLEVDADMRRLFVRAFDNLDGIAYRTSSWFTKHEFTLWEQRQTLYVLVAWYLESFNPELKTLIDRQISALAKLLCKDRFGLYFKTELTGPKTDMGAVSKTENGEPFACINAQFADPLARYAIATGDSQAAEMAQGLCKRLLCKPGGYWLVNDTDSFCEIRCELSGLAGLVRTALLDNNENWLVQGKVILDYICSQGLSMGHYPWQNHLACEPCVIADVIDIAIVLAKNGFSEYWNIVDLAVRNQLIEGIVCSKGVFIPEAERKAKKERVSYQQVKERTMGAYAFVYPGSIVDWGLMLCCGGTVGWSLNKVWQNIVTDETNCITVQSCLFPDTKSST